MDLPPQTVPTPANQTTVVTTIRRPLRNRVLALCGFAANFTLGLVAYLSGLNLQNLGLTPTQSYMAFAAFGLIQFIILQFYTPISVDNVRAVPAAPPAPGPQGQQ